MTAFEPRPVFSIVAWLIAIAAAGMARGAEPAVNWKYTYTFYRTAGERNGVDLNLRGNYDATAFWLGHYERDNEFHQSRAGIEQSMALDWAKFVLSGQAATHGFLGFAAQAEVGTGAVRMLAGFGRTNLKDYYNLNFDPNDAITLGVVADLPHGMRASLYAVHDDRLGTGETVVHALLRTSGDASDRWTLDLFQRRGPEGDSGDRAKRLGFGATYDRSPYFGRIVFDQNANFSGHNMVRLGIGARF